MEAQQLRKKTREELQTLLNAERNDLRELRFGLELKQAKKVRQIRAKKKNVARLLTILNEKIKNH